MAKYKGRIYGSRKLADMARRRDMAEASGFFATPSGNRRKNGSAGEEKSPLYARIAQWIDDNLLLALTLAGIAVSGTALLLIRLFS